MLNYGKQQKLESQKIWLFTKQILNCKMIQNFEQQKWLIIKQFLNYVKKQKPE